jgi:hypothetical protein
MENRTSNKPVSRVKENIIIVFLMFVYGVGCTYNDKGNISSMVYYI